MFVRRQLRRAATEKYEVEREASHPPVPIPYLFYTPKVFSFHMYLIKIEIFYSINTILNSTLINQV